MDELQQFNSWYSSNYKKLLSFAKRNHIEEDLLHDSYIKIVEKIEKSGYETNQYMTYCKRSLVNMNINNGKKKRYHFVDTEDKDFRTMIEMKLIDIDETQKDDQLYQEELMYFSKMLFKYIDSQSYTDEEKFIFRSYFLLRGRLTYEKLTEITGINKNRLTEVLTRMKKDIKDNLENWIQHDK